MMYEEAMGRILASVKKMRIDASLDHLELRVSRDERLYVSDVLDMLDALDNKLRELEEWMAIVMEDKATDEDLSDVLNENERLKGTIEDLTVDLDYANDEIEDLNLKVLDLEGELEAVHDVRKSDFTFRTGGH